MNKNGRHHFVWSQKKWSERCWLSTDIIHICTEIIREVCEFYKLL